MANNYENAVIEPTDQMMDRSESNGKILTDKYYMSYLLFYALGTLTLIPANFFATATDYWMYKFRDINTDNITNGNRTELQAQFTSSYSIVSNISNVIFLVITFVLSKKISIVKRLLGALCSMVLLFGFTVLFVIINTDTWQTGFFVITLITGALLGASGSVFMVSLFELVSKFPDHYISSLLSGQSICGIFAALVEIFSIGIGASSQIDGLVYFLVGMIFVFFTLISFILTLYKSEYFYYHLTKPAEQTQRPQITKEDIFHVLNKIKFYLLSMVIVLGCSIMVHPAVTSLVQSTSKGNGNKWNDAFFVPVTTFLSYNIFDWIGRETAGQLQRPSNDIVIFIASICRIGFVPILMFCNAQPRHHLSVAFGDAAYIIFIIIFGLSNGFLVNLCILKMPSITLPEEKHISIGLVVLFMVISMGTCALLGSALVSAL